MRMPQLACSGPNHHQDPKPTLITPIQKPKLNPPITKIPLGQTICKVLIPSATGLSNSLYNYPYITALVDLGIRGLLDW